MATWLRTARADDENVIVVDVTQVTSEADADRLRAAIAQELHAAAVKPSDPRARSARGTVTIDMDPSSGKLSVTYLARSTPTTREIPLPTDAAAARGAAVMLAGNLARDEAGELAAALRKQTPPALAPAKAAVPESDTGVSSARLQGTLDYLAERESQHRTFAWTTMFVGGAASGTAIGELGPGFETARGGIVSGMASTASLGVIFGAGALTLYAGSAVDKLADAHRKGAESSVTEDSWRHVAQTERKLRRATGIVELSLGAVAITAGSVGLGSPGVFTSDDKRYAFTGVMVAVAAGEIVLGIYYLTTEGPVGAALHAYERSTGRFAPDKAALLEHLRIGVGPDGPAATFAMTF